MVRGSGLSFSIQFAMRDWWYRNQSTDSTLLYSHPSVYLSLSSFSFVPTQALHLSSLFSLHHLFQSLPFRWNQCASQNGIKWNFFVVFPGSIGCHCPSSSQVTPSLPPFHPRFMHDMRLISLDSHVLDRDRWEISFFPMKGRRDSVNNETPEHRLTPPVPIWVEET